MFGSRFGSIRARLGLSRLGALPGGLPFREAALRFHLDLKTVHSAVRFNLAKTKDAATRFQLKKTADVAERFKLQAQGYKDVATRVAFTLAGGPTTANILYFRNQAQRSDLVPTAGTHSGLSASVANSGSPFEDRMLSPQKGPSGGQTSFAIFSTTGTRNFYMARGTSGPLKAQHVNAGNWITGVGQKVGNTFIEMASCDAIYIWRPSTSSVVATIRSSLGNASSPPNDNAEDWYINVYTGLNGGAGPAFDTQDGDVLVWEVWFSGSYAVTTGNTTFFFNGSDASKANRAAVSDAASYIRAPQALQFINPSDAHMRFKMWVGPKWRDTQMLVWLRLGGYAFATIRTNLAQFFFRETSMRVELRPGNVLVDAAMRAVYRPLAFKDPQLRFNVPTWTYRDAGLRIALQILSAIKDAQMRCNLIQPTFQEPTVRFQLQEETFQGLALLDETTGLPIWQKTQASDF